MNDFLTVTIYGHAAYVKASEITAIYYLPSKGYTALRMGDGATTLDVEETVDQVVAMLETTPED